MPTTLLDLLWRDAMGSVPAKKRQKGKPCKKSLTASRGGEAAVENLRKKTKAESDEEAMKENLQVTLNEEEKALATSREGAARKAPPPRWRKRNFATRIKRNWFRRAKKLKSTFEVLPKFIDHHYHQKQQQQEEEKQQAVPGETVVPAEEVRQLVSRLVLREHGLVDAVLDSYNTFLNELTRAETLFTHEHKNKHGSHEVRLADVAPGAVRHTPLQCRLEKRCYVLPLTVQASYRWLNAQGAPVRAFAHRVVLGEMPLMVGSRLCPTAAMTAEERVAAGQQPDEPGGYFIVDGVEKFIPFQSVLIKNSPMVVRCSGLEGQRFSHKCYVLSSVSGIDTHCTAVLATRKDTLQARLRLGRSGTVVLPLSTVLAATGIHEHHKTLEETESVQFLRQTLATMLPPGVQHQQQRNKGRQEPLTRHIFRGHDGVTSSVAAAILDYLGDAKQLLGVTQQDLQGIHDKCERSATRHAVLLRIAAKYGQTKEKEEQQVRRRLAALKQVMLQGCEDVPHLARMARAAVTLPARHEAQKAVKQAAKGPWRRERLDDVLQRALVPHVGGGLFQRAFYLAYLTNQLLLNLCGRRADDDPLHLGNRLLLTPGALNRRLFDSVLQPLLQRARDTFQRKCEARGAIFPEELSHVELFQDDSCSAAAGLGQRHKIISEKYDLLNIFHFQHNVVGEAMCRAFRTGKWGAMTSVTQNLQRLNYMQYLSQMRTVNGDAKVLNGKDSRPHELHTSTVGFLCPIETPESEHVGLTEHLAIGASVCNKVDATHLHKVLQTLPVTLFAAGRQWPAPDRMGKVFLDGRWVGNAKVPLRQVRELLLQHRRRHGLHLGVHLRHHDLHLDASGGRAVRPLLVVLGGALTATPDDLAGLRGDRCSLDDLWRRGVVDFLDPKENSEAFIAEKPGSLGLAGVDYCQLLAVLSHGVVSAATPAATNNPGVRRLGSCKMQKQAMGPSVLSEALAHRGTYSVLKTPEMPLALPAFILEQPNARLMYAGQSALTAVLAVRGLNQEDGLVFSRGAVDRGLFTSCHSHTYCICEPHLGAVVVSRAEVGRRIAGGAVLITCKNKRDHVLVQNTHGPGTVVSSVMRRLPDGRVLHEVVTLEERRPEVGDKFGTLNGQKGVICGILPDHQLPRLEDGRTPDVFISPHSFLDRQTVGFFVEGILNTLALHRGTQLDATSIDAGWDLPRAQEALRKAGLSSSVSVRSAGGKPLGRVFCAPIFFMRLKHRAVLKCHARHDGPLDPLFRQPQEGLAQGGGLRLGEMEVSALVSHGAADLVQMFLHDQSDGMQLPYCNACHRWASTMAEYASCRRCLRTDSLVLRKTNYPFRYFEESLALQNLKLVQLGRGQYPGSLGVQYEASDLSSQSSGEEGEWQPGDEEPLQEAMETVIKNSWRDDLLLDVGGAGPVSASPAVREASSKGAWSPTQESTQEEEDAASSEGTSE
ncbi:DNA-directed RNA polymerase II subunit RPB2-like [Eriocheir sinensis]|uniref:DNA-directed RNA polymerase II subunit RPB2-like n=1 Tax=Eriocheir sinensis TaxID=95602 RepID=UPI0021C811F9|nr:DNA-directed RNA polymerase II subunit RPB2-like [Eriocheir sinensis]XP_050721394.1 DNA-directed RNA polymerase II subunit RPB2-like [Eriocheir sinensis]XP_050721395.1 DNA-directed RNA polymerase II subunit RPB2-like [Eriocheir sinensis]